MKPIVVGIVLAICLAYVLSAPKSREFKNNSKWKNFSSKFNAKFDNDDDEEQAFINFNSTDTEIESHNSNPNATYKLGHNEFSHWSKDKLNARNGLKIPNGLNLISKRSVGSYSYTYSGQNHSFKIYYATSGYALKTSVDWVKAGWNTTIRNQGSCGDCWAFATTGAVEASLWKNNKTTVTLSPQQLTDCSLTYGNNGCNGGVVAYAYGYINDNGICQDSFYPFNGSLRNCTYNGGTGKAPLYKVKTYYLVNQTDDNALMEALDLFGPLPVGIDASKISSYKSGIFAVNSTDCSKTINHAVVLTGYGVDTSGNKYWTIKNSWGATWGNSGYMNISRVRTNNCGISSQVFIPIF